MGVPARTLVLAPCALLLLAACSSPGKPAPTPPPSSSTSVTATPVASTSTTVQTSGVRTVLSPLGLNIRGGPSTSAAVLGTAAQGTVLTVLGHTAQGGGWFSVRGATVTGWVTDNARLTAEGRFKAYSSDPLQFSALYPDTWTVAESPPARVVFHLPAGAGTVVVTTAATVAALGSGRAGYQRGFAAQVVLCGVTSELVTYTQLSPPPTTAPGPAGMVAEHYLAQARLTLDATHALGFDANLADLSAFGGVRDFLNSVAFPFPQCEK